MRGNGRSWKASDGRRGELTEAVGRRMDTLLDRGARELPRPTCAKPEVLLELMVCQSSIPLPRIAEVLGLRYPGDFSYWCECVTGLAPQVLRELGAPRPVDVRPPQVRPAEARPAQARPAELPPAPQARPAVTSSEPSVATLDPAASADDDHPPPPAPSSATWCRLLTLPMDRMRPADRAALEWLEASRPAAPRPLRRRRTEDSED